MITLPNLRGVIDSFSRSTYVVDYAVVAGGGGGGGVGGGGGGGGVRRGTLRLIPGTVYNITVGAGGAQSGKGNDSSFASVTSSGGGLGGSSSTQAGGTGGCGGGAPGCSLGAGSGVAGEGFGGGAGSGCGSFGGGGGGAGMTGYAANCSVTTGGDGGDGVEILLTGSSVYLGGGGGGFNFQQNCFTPGRPNGGLGGGGEGSCWYGCWTQEPTSGSANTGGGGGARSYSATALGVGGSGVVYVRIPTAKYTGTYTGTVVVHSPTGYTTLQFNSSGSYTA